jgi:hypothetical protein
MKMADQRDRITDGSTITSCPTKHVAITPGVQRYNPPVHVWVGGAGDVEIEDDKGTVIVYTLAVGTIAPVRATRVLADNTTASNLVGIF